MKKLYTLMALAVTCFSVTAQIVNIPDAALKNILINTTCATQSLTTPVYTDVDLNNDGEVQVSEALLFQALSISSNQIYSAVGMEAFANLKHLVFSNTHVSDTAPLSQLTQLTFLRLAGDHQMTAFNFDLMTNLENVTVTNCNGVTALDFSQTKVVEFNVTNNDYLKYVNLKNGYMSVCDYGPDDGCLQWFGLYVLKAVCRDEGELTTGPSYSPLPWGVITSYCTFGPAGEYNTISGSLLFDCGGTANPLHNVPVNVVHDTESTTIFPYNNGNFVYYTGTGQVTLTPQLPNAAYFNISPASATFDFATLENQANANFCVTPNGVHPDVEVSIHPNGVARPGFNAHYTLVYANKGNQVQSGTVTLAFEDAKLDFVSASQPATESAGLLSWTFSDLQLFETRTIDIVLNVNSPMETPAVNNGDILNYTAAILAGADDIPADNTQNYLQTVVGSFDPNDKSVSQSTIGIAQLDEYLYYTIRFQNTGDYAAENVVIKDMLSNNLDLSTLQTVAQSHTGYRTLKNGNELEFFFEGINLPALSVDEPGSHGFVTYRIKPTSTLTVDTVIENNAEIYFDFNFPIETNTVTTTLTALGIPDNLRTGFSLYPNPAVNSLTIALDTIVAVKSVAVFNTLGQKVMAIAPMFENGGLTVPIGNLNRGTYFVQLVTENGSVTKKLIKF
jgi:uncharacterized repeat protein (TIGR01451 family)